MKPQARKPRIGVTGKSATLKVRGMSGRVLRRITTATLTRPKAKRVPMLVASASLPSGMKAARTPQKRETMTTLARGAPVFSSTLAKTLGTRPSRDIAKRMRVWP